MLRKQAHLSRVTYLNMKKKHKDMGGGGGGGRVGVGRQDQGGVGLFF